MLQNQGSIFLVHVDSKKPEEWWMQFQHTPTGIDIGSPFMAEHLWTPSLCKDLFKRVDIRLGAGDKTFAHPDGSIPNANFE